MENPRKYGCAPFHIALLHGGPGAAGEMASVALELSESMGILEPLQTATTLEGQVVELDGQLEDSADFPVVLVGYSWGAWLGFIYAAHFQSKVKKLVMISSGPFQAHYSKKIEANRLARLSAIERKEALTLLKRAKSQTPNLNAREFERLGYLMTKTDSYDLLPETKFYEEAIEMEVNAQEIFNGVWPTAAKMRASGELLKLANEIECPVVGIHGQFDPHPAEGVISPLSSCLKEFHFITLDHCGHTPWKERQAQENFYTHLKREVSEY